MTKTCRYPFDIDHSKSCKVMTITLFFTLLDGTKSPMYRVIPFKRTPVTLNSKTSVPLSHSKATTEHVEVEFKFGISTTTEY